MISRYWFLAFGLTLSQVWACNDPTEPPPPPPPPTVEVVIDSFTADPNPGVQGGMTTLAWQVREAARVRILRGAEEIFSTEQETASGSFSAELPNLTNNFTLEASNGEIRATESVVVRAEQENMGNPRILSFTASEEVLTMVPQRISLLWNVANASEVSLQANGAAIAEFPGGAQGSFEIEVAEATTFTLTAVGNGMTTMATVEVTVFGTEIEPNASAQTATPITDTHDANLNPQGDVDYFSVEVPEGGHIIASTTDPMGGCTIDTVLRLIGPDGVTELGLNDDVNTQDGQFCSIISAEFNEFARGLAAGTYYLEVTGYTDEDGNSVTGSYVLNVEVRAPGCPNAIVDSGEQCDDGNTDAGDGCDPSCAAEISAALTGPELNQVLSGSLSSGSASYTELTVTSTAFVRVQTFVPAAPGCTGDDNDTVVFLLNDSFEVIAANDDGGEAFCSRLDPDFTSAAQVSPGTYYLLIQPFGATEVPAYEVRVELLSPGCGNGVNEDSEGCDDGNTAAGDGCDAVCALEPQATIEPPGGSATVTLERAADIRALAVNITMPGQTITATLGDGMACGPFPDLQLYDPALSLLGTTFSDPGDMECAGLGAGLSDFSTNLALGTHLVAVVNAGGEPGPVDLQIGVSNPACGNSILESRANEACEDGNIAGGDGCDASCQFEQKGFVREMEPNNNELTAMTTGVVPGASLTTGGTIDPLGDEDWFAFEVPVGQTATLTARTFGNLLDDTACQGDTRVELIDAAGVVIAENDDDPVNGNLCSRISVESVSMAATDLPAGNYFVRVYGFADLSIVPVYYLDIELQ